MPINPLGWDLTDAIIDEPVTAGRPGDALVNPLGWDLVDRPPVAATGPHDGRHGPGCDRCTYAAKLKSLSFDRGRPKTHLKNGDPWKDNPVVDRIRELTGVEVNTDVPRPEGAS